MHRLLVTTLALTFVTWLAPDITAGGLKHPHLHYALREMREVRTELKEAAHDFGGHRAKAIEGLNGAIKQIDECLKAVGDNTRGAGKADPGIYKRYANHPHIRHSLYELKETRTELRDAAHNYGGHREKALRDVNYAIDQLELALKFDRK